MVSTTPRQTNGAAHAAPAAPPMDPQLMPLRTFLGEWAADAQAAFDARVNGVARGPVTGLKGLDDVLGGVLQPGLHVVRGGPGVGKTALGLQLAASCGFPALYVSCEMRPLELLRRITARVTGTYLGRLKSGELDPDQSLKKARQACDAASQLVLVDATQAFADYSWLLTAGLIAQGQARHLLIVVDSVHSWAEGSPVGLTEYDALNGALATLRTLAGALGCPILAIAERNRASMSGGGLSASAGSRRFEYGGESVLDLSVCDKPDIPTPPDEKAITLLVAKNRNGPAGKRLALHFHGALQRFTEA